MNIFFRLPKGTLVYNVEVKTFNDGITKPENVITYKIHISLVKDSFSGYVVKFKKANLLLNNSGDYDPIYEILAISAQALDDMELVISGSGEIVKVKNLKEIQKLWSELLYKIESTYKGDIVDKIIKPIDKTIKDEKLFIKKLYKDSFFHSYFNGIFGTYSTDVFNKGSYNLLISGTPVKVANKGRIVETDTKRKAVNIDHFVSPQDLDTLQQAYSKKKGEGKLSLNLRTDYIISESDLFEKIESLYEFYWNNRLFKSQQVKINLI